MVDKSWGGPPLSNVRVRTNDSLEERAARRARERENRAQSRDTGMAERLEARAKAREAGAAERERIRQERREAEAKLAQSDPHTAAAQRRRGSGRKDIVREERDTTGYAMVVDPARIRTLADRGASVDSLAAVLGLSVQEIKDALASGSAEKLR
ncbi:hypothetical protein [Sphingomonas dokdonensis]|uniref:Uncharacterized protein n=1 Tax=Sphingomonas dokdonensis TaxID=344880 RepID=A0A245ZJV5_9SPHN|nr:hypothetical protein [Sphingomonas dokdonensis]OWK30030.1 hypothetical protein SPDO_17110 [Sphingomonas dokdonensis]